MLLLPMLLLLLPALPASATVELISSVALVVVPPAPAVALNSYALNHAAGRRKHCANAKSSKTTSFVSFCMGSGQNGASVKIRDVELGSDTCGGGRGEEGGVVEGQDKACTGMHQHARTHTHTLTHIHTHTHTHTHTRTHYSTTTSRCGAAPQLTPTLARIRIKRRFLVRPYGVSRTMVSRKMVNCQSSFPLLDGVGCCCYYCCCDTVHKRTPTHTYTQLYTHAHAVHTFSTLLNRRLHTSI